MLTFLRVRGLALLEDVTLELGAGMTVLTGETGAGKSILVDALALLRGARAHPELLRSGAPEVVVEAEFSPAAQARARVSTALERHGLPSLEDGTLVLTRRLAPGGRGRALVQGALTTQAVLAEVGAELLEICSQHEHHSLGQVGHHLTLLDAWAGLGEQVALLQERHRSLRELEQELTRQRALATERLARVDWLRFQHEELTRVAPEPGEHTALSERVTLLRGARDFAALATELGDTLEDGPDPVLERLLRLAERARRGGASSSRLARIAEHLDAARASLAEAAREAARLARELEMEPGELERCEARLSDLTLLSRKHGVNPDALRERAADLAAELGALEGAEASVSVLETRRSQLLAECLELARRLSAERVRHAQTLGAALERELEALHLAGARLQARVETLGESALGPRGFDRAELLFSANPGEPLAPLARVASGGELSRVLLALKGVLAVEDRVATYVFDEVDAGVGGAAAEAIGLRLCRAARHHQVLCITHLPQIAAFASDHVKVSKVTEGGRTLTVLRKLAASERVEELARMLGGARVTETAREHARALLADAARAAPGARAKGIPAARTPRTGRRSRPPR